MPNIQYLGIHSKIRREFRKYIIHDSAWMKEFSRVFFKENNVFAALLTGGSGRLFYAWFQIQEFIGKFILVSLISFVFRHIILFIYFILVGIDAFSCSKFNVSFALSRPPTSSSTPLEFHMNCISPAYIVVTTPTSDNVNNLWIIGVVFGSLFALILLIWCILFCLHQSHSATKEILLDTCKHPPTSWQSGKPKHKCCMFIFKFFV